EIYPRVGEHRPDRERADERAYNLTGPVRRKLTPWKALGGGESKGHRRIDVTARHLAERIYGSRDDEPEGERDPKQVSASDRRGDLARQLKRSHHRPGAYQHKQGGSDRLGQCALGKRVLLHPSTPFPTGIR